MKRAVPYVLAGIAVLLAIAVFLWRESLAPPSAPSAPAAVAVLPQPSPPPRSEAPLAAAPQEAPAAAPSFDVVRVGRDGNAVIAGRAVPGSKVTVLDGETPLGTVTADRNGEWVLLPDRKLAPGSRQLGLKARQEGGTEVASAADVVLVVPEPNRDVAGRPAAEPATPLAMVVPKTGDAVLRPLQVPPTDPANRAAQPEEKGRLALDVIEYDAAGRVALGGRAEPGADVLLYLGNRLIGRAKSDSAGSWFARPDETVAPGRYTLRVDQIRPDGKVAQRLSLPFQQAAAVGSSPGNLVVVQPGNSLWRIARETYGAGPRYAVIYEANREQIADPDLIYPGQIFKLPN